MSTRMNVLFVAITFTGAIISVVLFMTVSSPKVIFSYMNNQGFQPPYAKLHQYLKGSNAFLANNRNGSYPTPTSSSSLASSPSVSLVLSSLPPSSLASLSVLSSSLLISPSLSLLPSTSLSSRSLTITLLSSPSSAPSSLSSPSSSPSLPPLSTSSPPPSSPSPSSSSSSSPPPLSPTPSSLSPSSPSSLFLSTGKGNVTWKFMNDKFLENNRDGSYPMPLPCPYFHLRRAGKTKKETYTNTTVYCIEHKSSNGACEKASSYFGNPNNPLGERKCSETHHPDICTFKRTALKTFILNCKTSICKSSVSMGVLDMDRGVISNWETISPFNTENARKFVKKRLKTHDFAFIRCDGILQALVFPPKTQHIKGSKFRHRININIIVLDSIARPHFYRVMRKSIDTMRKVVYDESIPATVLDFELFQSISMHTFDNMRPLFSGIVQGKIDFSQVQKTQMPLGIHVLNDAFKSYGYQTLYQEDVCWHDHWGVNLNNMLRNDGKASKGRWREFQKIALTHHIDRYGLTFFSCEVLKKYGLTNHFDRPSQVCLNGQFYNEYFLNYIKDYVEELQQHEDSAPVLSYSHINSAHTDTGSRIRNDDNGLSNFILSMARDPNSLTIIMSDHGHTRTGYGRTDEGKRELYHPLLFMIVPYYVAGLLGKERMDAMVTNQKRLLTTMDLHRALMTLHDTNISTDYKVSGVFAKIPPTRKCDDVQLMPMVRCQCEGSETKLDDNAHGHRWLAEFALGSINNIVQKQYSQSISKDSPVRKGFGNCVRMIGTSFRHIVQNIAGTSSTFNVHINAINVGLQDDEIFTFAVQLNGGIPTLKSFDRQTLYNKFKPCSDKSVEIKLCACDKGKSVTEVNVLKPKEMKAFMSTPMFDSVPEIEDMHGGCLFQVKRQHKSSFSVAYEVANSCEGQKFRISVSGSYEYVFVSRSLPFSEVVEPNEILFLFSAARQILNFSFMDISITSSKI